MFDYYKIIKIFDEDFDEDKHPGNLLKNQKKVKKVIMS